jgi:hypothetical protein
MKHLLKLLMLYCIHIIAAFLLHNLIYYIISILFPYRHDITWGITLEYLMIAYICITLLATVAISYIKIKINLIVSLSLLSYLIMLFFYFSNYPFRISIITASASLGHLILFLLLRNIKSKH